MSHNDLPFLPKKNLEAWKLACNFNHQGFHVGHFRNLTKNLNHHLKRLEKFYGVINLIKKTCSVLYNGMYIEQQKMVTKWFWKDWFKFKKNAEKYIKTLKNTELLRLW